MRTTAIKSLFIVAAAFIIVIGCATELDPTARNVIDPTSAASDNSFSDAPASPGGTGGIIEDSIQGEGEETQSFFTGYWLDPESEDTAGPKFVISADINQDGLLDLVSAWNESQPIQLHIQKRDLDGKISFRTINLGGTSPIALTAGIEVGHINDDEWLDIVVLVKATGAATLCPPTDPGGDWTEIGVMDGLIIVLFNPGNAVALEDGNRWSLMQIGDSNRFPGMDTASFYESATKPELSGYVSLAVGEIDGAPGDDIVVAFNAAECESLGQKPPINTVELYPNPGGALSESGTDWLHVNIDSIAGPQVKDLLLMDIDEDGDLDIVSSWTDAISSNIQWRRNPLFPHTPGGPQGTNAVHSGSLTWEYRPLGHVATGSDILAAGDIDTDGAEDVVVRSTVGQIVQWFRRPTAEAIEPIFPPPDAVPDRNPAIFPWQVYTLATFEKQDPEAVSVGDLTGDGQVEVVIAAEGAVYWYSVSESGTVYDEWTGVTMIRDSGADETDPTSSTPAAPSGGAGTVTEIDTSTHINTLLPVDLDGDGKLDVIGTLDRRTGSGLFNDRLVWYRNIRTEEEAE